MTKKDRVDEARPSFQEKKKRFMAGLGIHRNRFLLCSNYCDDTDPLDCRHEIHNTAIDLPILKFFVQAQIDAIIKAAEQMYSDLLEERIRKVKEETERNFTASLNKIATELNQTCEAKIQATKEKITIEMGEMQTETVSKISNVDSRQDFMFTLIHQLGFMRLAEVLLIIYDDPTEGDVGEDELYSRRLSQVRDHDLLKQLDRKGRVLSIKRGGQLKDHQKEHIVKELNLVFQ
nr:hypothetical protein BaRGS_013230 [Batillaria attramentaria]